MAIVLVKPPPVPDGMYVIKNRAADIFWYPYYTLQTVCFYPDKNAKEQYKSQWDIKHDTDGNIFMRSLDDPSSWAGADLAWSSVPVPWRLIPADSKSYYLTTDMNRDSQNPRVPVAPPNQKFDSGNMATLMIGDKWQMWEFIRI